MVENYLATIREGIKGGCSTDWVRGYLGALMDSRMLTEAEYLSALKEFIKDTDKIID